jgi:DnaD/phage-associated family protein
MTQFQGFPSGGRVQYTPIPNAFFSSLLPQVMDIAELKAILYIMAMLYVKKGYPRFITYGDLLENDALMQGINRSKEKLGGALKLAVEHGALLSVTIKKDSANEDIYFLNDVSSRQAVERIQTGTLKLVGMKAVAQPPVEKEEQPNIYKLFEDNVGVLMTPLIADELRDMEKLYPEDWIRDAIKEAVLHNKRNIKYIAKILENWSVEGRSDGTYQRDTKATGPDKYFKGKYGHMVRR